MRHPPGRLLGTPLSAERRRACPGDLPRVASRPGGSHMTSAPEFSHVPVLLGPVVDLLSAVPAGWVADCTLGGGGHAAALLEAAPQLRVLGLDRDADARAAATERLAKFGERVRVVAARFDALSAVCAEQGIDELSGALFDLGVSSPQLDRPERGFSHRGAGPLDMRMDRSTGRTAAQVVNSTDEAELTVILRQGGEERFAGRVARAIIAARPVDTTAHLAEIVRAAIPAPARRRGGDPANRTFQAIRIAVNDELETLRPALEAAVDLLAVGGRLVVLAYHSGEDRIVKRTLGAATEEPTAVGRGLPIAGDSGGSADLRRLRGIPRTAPDEEIAVNRRASSVRLRGVERIRRTTPTTEGEA